MNDEARLRAIERLLELLVTKALQLELRCAALEQQLRDLGAS